jgi:hypothetical protein
VLLTVVAAQIAAILWIGGNGAFGALIRRFYQLTPQPQVMSQQEWEQILAWDPKLGTPVPSVVLKDSDGNPLKLGTANRSGGLFLINACKQCVANHLARWDQYQKSHPELDLYVVPVMNDREAVRSFKRDHQLDVRFVAQGNDELIDKCNPFFLPRVYLFDRAGRFTYIQPPDVSTGSALAHVKTVIESEKEQRG